MKRYNILITGGNGMLASHIKSIFTKETSHQIYCLGRQECDITEKVQLEEVVNKHHIEIIINTAAYTAVDLAETEKEAADKINHLGVQNIAQVANNNDIQVIHISTDYVFDGEQSSPIKEEEPTNPLSVYGQTKRDGELALQKQHSRSIIIRTSWLYDGTHPNFFTTMKRLGGEKKEISVVNDQFGTPTYAPDLANAIRTIITHWSNGNNPNYDIYHYSGEGITSWYDFAQEIFFKLAIPCAIHPVSTEQFVRPAQRPKFAVLDKNKIKYTFGIKIPTWRESLQKCIEQDNLD